jgi:hypothetical protein
MSVVMSDPYGVPTPNNNRMRQPHSAVPSYAQRPQRLPALVDARLWPQQLR